MDIHETLCGEPKTFLFRGGGRWECKKCGMIGAIVNKVFKPEYERKMQIYIKKLPNFRKMPQYAKQGDAGMDLYACIDQPVTLFPMERRFIPCGIAIQIPDGYECQIRSRSGLSKAGVVTIDGVSTIDAGYRGELGAPLINLSGGQFTIQPGDRICQMVINKIELVDIVEVERLTDSERGATGFGSSGI